jgi:hypothetical protein
MTAGVPICATPCHSSSSVAAPTNGTVGKPWSARKVFSRMRSCATPSAAPDGRTGVIGSITSTASTGTFSNSKVTTPTPRAKARNASTSAYSATISLSATWPVGVSWSGEKV